MLLSFISYYYYDVLLVTAPGCLVGVYLCCCTERTELLLAKVYGVHLRHLINQWDNITPIS
jgi:hypothetical protein